MDPRRLLPYLLGLTMLAVLVTGGSGFVGRVVVAREVEAGELLEGQVGGRLPAVVAGAVAPPRLEPRDRLTEHRDQLVGLARVALLGQVVRPGVDEPARGQVLLARR